MSDPRIFPAHDIESGRSGYFIDLNGSDRTIDPHNWVYFSSIQTALRFLSLIDDGYTRDQATLKLEKLESVGGDK